MDFKSPILPDGGKRTWKLALMIGLSALALRMLALYLKPPVAEEIFTPLNDPTDFDFLARMILEGKYCAPNVQPSAFRPPLYPLFLAVIYAICGHGNILAVAMTQVVLGAINAVLVMLTSRVITRNTAVAVTAGLAYALYPAYIFQTGNILSEVLGRTLFLAGLLAFVSAIRRRKGSLLAWAGVLWALGILNKPTFLASLPFAGIWLVIYGYGVAGMRIRTAVIAFLIPAVLTIAPWTARNWMASGRFIPVSTNFPVTFAHGMTRYSYYANHWYGPERLMEVPDNFQDLTQLRFYGGMRHELAVGDYFKKQALDFIRDNPGFVARLTFRRILHFWSPFIRNAPLERLAAFFSMGPVMLLGWLGILAGLRRRGQPRAWAVLALCIAVPASLPYILSQPDVRYRISLIDPLWMIAGACLAVHLVKEVRRGFPHAASFQTSESAHDE